MGLHTSALFVEGRALHEVLRVLPDVYQYHVTGALVPAEPAVGGGGHDGFLYGLAGAGWCQVWDPDRSFAPHMEKVLADGGRFAREAIADTDMLAVSFNGLLDQYAFWFWRKGDLVRHARFERTVCVEQTGAPLAGERKHAAHGEDLLWSIIAATTGSRFDDDAQFIELAVTP